MSRRTAHVTIGRVLLRDTGNGLLIVPNLRGLSPGLHGFHVHQNPHCGPANQGAKIVPGLRAGGHFDPKSSDRHMAPFASQGHLGDLPPLYVDQSGAAVQQVLAPRLKAVNLAGRSIVIHAGPDNFADKPKPLGGGGGGGARIACGVVR